MAVCIVWGAVLLFVNESARQGLFAWANGLFRETKTAVAESPTMKVAVNLLLFTTHLTPKHQPLLESLRGLGADGVEVPILEGTPDHYGRMNEMIWNIWEEESSISAVTMTSKEADMSSPNRKVRDRGVTVFKKKVDCAVALGSEALVGPFSSPWALWPKDRAGRDLSGERLVEEMEKRLQLAVPCLQEVADYACARSVALCTEYLNPWELPYLNTIGQCTWLSRLVNRANFGILADTAHEAAGAGPKIFGKEIKKLTNATPLRIHISAPVHRGDITESSIDWSMLSTLKAIGWNGTLTLEIFNAVAPFAQGARLNRTSWTEAECLEMVERAIPFVKEKWESASSTLFQSPGHTSRERDVFDPGFSIP